MNGGEQAADANQTLAGERPRERVISELTVERMRWLLRLVVLHGSGGNADVEGYLLGGKTGTANNEPVSAIA